MPADSFLKTKQPLLQKRPLVAGVLVGVLPVDAQIRTARQAGVDLIELRLDSFYETFRPFNHAVPFSLNLVKNVRKKSRLPVLLTLRSHTERGVPVPDSKQITDPKRVAIIQTLLPLCAMVDFEIKHLPMARYLTPVAHRLGVNVIHSVHDFHGLLPFRTLRMLSQKSLQLKGDIFKVATTPHTNDELEIFLQEGRRLQHPRPALIGMGKVGLVSRVLAYTFGSVLTYGHLGSKTAPGQMAAGDLTKSIGSVYGR